MNVNVKLILPALVAAAALSACSSTSPAKPAQKAAGQAAHQVDRAEVPPTLNVTSIDSTKEVAYRCGNEKLNVMYGIKGNDVVVAQVKYQNELTPNLNRVSNVSDFNAFWGNGISWSTDAADAANITKVNGNMLTELTVTTVNGKQVETNGILFKECVLDKAATAKLNMKK
ncbi:hypothetical protein [Neisseria animalis]|uniref:Excinuclease ABC subunit A n=1 Tax=Neisseria animalis TaxID=492 RepID=A0A5P3MNN9_NEIAN|nr:hypothetical protein [Neisseria animalis]QEY23162.1 hypothetical protein D0T90_00425 [Neisseria animalis]ROW32493.1 hypothetical protein CGZ60_05130 [Neisseria animalis]VEE08274.1 Uncharacterised protein [Neisseria animalis]